MKAITGVSLAFILHASFYAPTFVSAATSQPFAQNMKIPPQQRSGSPRRQNTSMDSLKSSTTKKEH
jgi:hypothetical protein